eukprot:6211993-Pleurochrysis_carterae.AAC.3
MGHPSMNYTARPSIWRQLSGKRFHFPLFLLLVWMACAYENFTRAAHRSLVTLFIRVRVDMTQPHA